MLIKTIQTWPATFPRSESSRKLSSVPDAATEKCEVHLLGTHNMQLLSSKTCVSEENDGKHTHRNEWAEFSFTPTS